MAQKPPLSPHWTLAIVFVLAVLVRSGTFFLGHMGGDQTHYTALAMKLDAMGLDGYSLRDVSLRPDANGRFTDLIHEINPLFPLAESSRTGGASPEFRIFYVPPLFAECLRLSHALFQTDGPYRLWLKRPLAFIRPDAFHVSEFYAAFPPLLFSLGTIFITSVLAWRHFGGPQVAIVAAALLAVSPVDILASNRVWPDTAATFFLSLSLFVYLEAIARQSKWLSFLGGAALGLAILSKSTAVFFVPSVVIASAVGNWRRGGLSEMVEGVLNTTLFFYLSTAFIVTLPWHAAMSAAYGNPFYWGPFSDADGLVERSRLVHAVDAFFQNPAFLLWLMPLRHLIRGKRLSEAELQAFVFPLVLAVTLSVFWPGREERDFLPAYPALALVSAISLERLRRALDKRGDAFGTSVTALAFGASALWSLGLAYLYLFVWQSDAIPVPF